MGEIPYPSRGRAFPATTGTAKQGSSGAVAENSREGQSGIDLLDSHDGNFAVVKFIKIIVGVPVFIQKHVLQAVPVEKKQPNAGNAVKIQIGYGLPYSYARSFVNWIPFGKEGESSLYPREQKAGGNLLFPAFAESRGFPESKFLFETDPAPARSNQFPI